MNIVHHRENLRRTKRIAIAAALMAAAAASLVGCGSSGTQYANVQVQAKVIGHVGGKADGAPLVRVNGETGVSFLVPETIAAASGATGTLVSVPSSAVAAGGPSAPTVDETPIAEQANAVHTYLTFSGEAGFHVVAAKSAKYFEYPTVVLHVTSSEPERVVVVFRTICGRKAPVSEDSVNYMGTSSALGGQTPLVHKLKWPLISVTNPSCWIAAAVAAANDTPVKLAFVKGSGTAVTTS